MDEITDLARAKQLRALVISCVRNEAGSDALLHTLLSDITETRRAGEVSMRSRAAALVEESSKAPKNWSWGKIKTAILALPETRDN